MAKHPTKIVEEEGTPNTEAHREASPEVQMTIDSPEFRRELDNFVRLIAEIRSNYSPTSSQSLDNGEA